MARTTIDIDSLVLTEVRALTRKEGRLLGEVVSQLLVEALAARKSRPPSKTRFRWIRKRMEARVDMHDKDSLFAALDRTGN